jgi:hypothetical protein
VPPATVEVAASDASLPDVAPHAGPSDVLEQWNEAHDRHDSAALAAIYAPIVEFYGAELSGADCVKRKEAAIAAAPDYRQSVADVERAPIDGNGGTFIRFTKKTTSNGSSKSYPSYVYAIDGKIVSEGDRVVESHHTTRYTYCYTPEPNDIRPGTIKVSGVEAVIALQHSKAFADAVGKRRGRFTIELRDCARGCAPGDVGTCKPNDLVPFFAVVMNGSDQLAAFVIDPVTKAIAVAKPAP